MINQMNLIKKSLLGLFLSCFIVTGYADASNYEVLKNYEDEKVFRVALVPKRKSKGSDNPFYYVVPTKFNQLVFVEHLTE